MLVIKRNGDMSFGVVGDMTNSRAAHRGLQVLLAVCILSAASCVRKADGSWAESPSAGTQGESVELVLSTTAETPAAVSPSEWLSPSSTPILSPSASPAKPTDPSQTAQATEPLNAQESWPTTPSPPTPPLPPTVYESPDIPSASPTLPVDSPLADCSATREESFEGEVVALINQEREHQGISSLAYQFHLAAAARNHSQDMACNGFFSHTGSDGSSPASRAAAQGYSFITIGENIYAGSGPYNSPEQAFNAWMNSPGHRTNMLNPEFSEVGVGHGFNASSPYGGYFTAMFGKP